MSSMAHNRPGLASTHSAGQPQFRPHHQSLGPASPASQQFASLSPNLAASGGAMSAQPRMGAPRQSLDAARALSAGMGPLSPRVPGMRPNSEMLGLGGQQGFGSNPEAEAIDKWFEDLQSYEATLEEMAAASLDANFKEELSAIEQWFRVLSEAERTAALYSLLQSSTQVQIRFFITVLQQMARSDPMGALLSPAPGATTPSMEQQMEAKLAQLSTKSPASPVVRQFARQSMGEGYLSPNMAAMLDASGGSNDAAALLASQRAKLKANNAANRVSAPGQMLSDGGLRSPKWMAGTGTVAEESIERHSRSPSPRPKSTGSDLQNNVSASQAAFAKAAAQVSGLESQLSPIIGGSWASQVNTPLVPMFGNEPNHASTNDHQTQQGMNDAANKLAQWGAAHQAGGVVTSTAEAGVSGIQLDDARKFRRSSKSVAATSPGFSGVLSGMGNQTQPTGVSSLPPGQQGHVSNPMLHPPRPTTIASGATSPIASGPALLNAQQAAAMAAQQNWRNGLNSPGMGMATPAEVGANLAMMNMMNGMNMNDPNNAAAIQNMANLLSMQQQMQQVQQMQALQQQMQGGMMGGTSMGMMNPGNNPMLSPVSAHLGMGFPAGFPMMNAGGGLGNLSNQKRSPGGRSPLPGSNTNSNNNNKSSHTPGSGSNPDEELDMKLLSDIPAWLRGLRLHKYTTNFETSTWQDMVMMNDEQLEARGVAAVGARRKMLRTFENVRLKKGMALPGDGEGGKESEGAGSKVDDTISSNGNDA